MEVELHRMKTGIENLKAGDSVYCTGYSGFCTPLIEKVISVTVQYDEHNGTPYNVIWLSDGRKFDSRTGEAMNPPTAYHIEPVYSDNPLLFSKDEEDLLVANNFYYVGHAMGKSWGSWEINKNGKRIYFRFNNDRIGSSKKVLAVVSKDGFNETEINTITSEMLMSLQ